MRSRRIVLPVVCLALMLGTLAGCENQKTIKQKGKAEWSRARANVLYGLAKDQYATGNFDPARKTVDEALRIDPEHEPLRVLSAKLAIENGSLEFADKELAIARKLNSKDPEADYLSGVVQQRWQKPEQALDYYTSASTKDPNELAYVLARSEMLVSAGRQDEALRLLQEKVVFFENSAVIRDAVGQLLMQKHKYTEASDMLRQASILGTGDPTITEHLAIALYFAGKYSEAIEPLQKLLKQDAYAKRADLLLVLGRSQLELGKAREARATLEKAAQLDESNAAVYLSLARTAMQLNDYRRAETSLKRAQALEPENSEVRLMVGYLRLKQNRLDEALASFQRASTLDSRDTVSLCMIGYTLKQLGRNDEAAKYYAKALKIKPGDDMAKRLMATVPLD
jgi:tetratricopeptide (TPR) repeat protein